MIDDFDETLRRLLIRELPIKKNEVDVKFDQPSREWSAKLSRPTLNVFLYDMRENVKLRPPTPQWVSTPIEDGKVSMRLRAVRMDLFYAVTAWAREPEDEHRLLSRTVMALLRTPFMPEDLLMEGLQDQPVPIPLEVAQNTSLQNPSDLGGHWTTRSARLFLLILKIKKFLPFIYVFS